MEVINKCLTETKMLTQLSTYINTHVSLERDEEFAIKNLVEQYFIRKYNKNLYSVIEW